MSKDTEGTFDIAVAGSGLVGSLAATLLSKLGYSVILLEKGRHPRFALGESSTPVTSHYFERFATMFGIPELMLCSGYERMKADPSAINCGAKELFYYLHHRLDTEVASFADMAPEIAVQLRGVDLQLDRAPLDAHMVGIARKYGATYVDDIDITDIEFRNDGVVLTCSKSREIVRYCAQFVIDGTGARSLLAEQLHLRVPAAELPTPLASRTIFTHFRGVKDLEEVFSGGCENVELPISRHRSTQHHVFDGGWYWFIPFDNGVTSVGLSLDMDQYPMNELGAEEEFWLITKRLSVVHAMLAGVDRVRPWVKTGRIQFLNKELVGDRWALLPAAAFGIDAWQSTGLSMSMISLDRLVWALHNVVFRFGGFKRESLQSYAVPLAKEFIHVSRFVDGIYKSSRHYELFRLFCLLPSIAGEAFALTGSISRPWDENSMFMFFGNPHWRTCFEHLYARVLELSKKAIVTSDEAKKLEEVLLDDLGRYNTRDFGSRRKKNIYLKQADAEVLLTRALAMDPRAAHGGYQRVGGG